VKFDWKAVVGIAISLALIWWVLSGEDLAEVWGYIREAHLGYLFLTVFVGTAGYLVRAMRWKVFLDPIRKDTGLHNRFKATCIGFAINNVFPMRLGEIARPVAFSRLEPVPLSATIGTLVVERLFDTIALTTFLIVPVLLPSFPRELLADNEQLLLLFRAAGVGVVGLFVVMLALLLAPKPTIRMAEAILGRFPGEWPAKAIDALEGFLEAIQTLRSPRVIVLGLVWSFAFWFWHGLSFWFGMLAFGVEAPLEAAFFVEAVIGFVVAIPAAPGFFGTFQAGAVLALATAYGAAQAPVIAFAFGYHISTFIPITIIGMIYASRVGFSVQELSDREELAQEAAGAMEEMANGVPHRDLEAGGGTDEGQKTP